MKTVLRFVGQHDVLSDTPPRTRNSLRYLAYVTVFAFLFLQTAVPIVGVGLERLPGDLGDGRFNLYLLEHTYKFISGQDPTFWTVGFFYPHENVVAYSDNFIGTSVFYIPFRMIGLDRETSFQCWVLIGFALNFLGMAVVLDRARFHWLSVCFGAAVFAFSPVQFLHLMHIQLLYRFAVPIAWYCLDRFLDQYRSSSLLLGLSFLLWQFYMSPYIGYFLTLLLVFYCLAIVIERKKQLVSEYVAGTQYRERVWHGILLAALPVGLLPLITHYSGATILRNSRAEVLDLLPRPASYFAGSRDGLMARVLGSPIAIHSTYPWEHNLFVGLVPWVALLAITAVAVLRRPLLRRQDSRMLIAFWCVFFVTLYVGGISAYQVLMDVFPILTGIRGMTRMVMVLLLPFGYVTAAAIDYLFCDGRNVNTRRLALPVVLAACVAFRWEAGIGSVTVEKAYAQRRVSILENSIPQVQRRTRVSSDGPVLAALGLDKSSSEYERQIDAMLAAQDLNIVTLNGYSRFLARHFRYFSDCESLAAMLRDYQRILPSFSARAVSERLVIVPSEISCEGHFTDPISKSPGRLPDDAYSALIVPKCLVCPETPGDVVELLVTLTNLSGSSWPQVGIALSTRFLRTGDAMALSGFDNRFPIGTDFAPHESKQYVIETKTPEQGSDYLVEVDIVQEMITWFCQKGTKRGQLHIHVRTR